VAVVGSLDIQQGDHIRVYKNAVPAGAGGNDPAFSFADFDRRGAMLWLTICRANASGAERTPSAATAAIVILGTLCPRSADLLAGFAATARLVRAP
jgi:hypothetical protein